MIGIPAAIVQVSKENPELCQIYPLCEVIPVQVPGGVSEVPRRWKCGRLRVGMVAGVLETSQSDMTCCVSVGEVVGRSLCPRVGGDKWIEWRGLGWFVPYPRQGMSHGLIRWQ